MSKRHFEAIADTIADLDQGIRQQVAEHFAKALDRTNPNFKEDRFIKRATGKRG